MVDGTRDLQPRARRSGQKEARGGVIWGVPVVDQPHIGQRVARGRADFSVPAQAATAPGQASCFFVVRREQGRQVKSGCKVGRIDSRKK